ASGQGSNDAIGNSPGVRWELAEGIESLPGWRKGVRGKKTETLWKIIGATERLVGSWEDLEVDL
ncbi:hypothetical protein BHE74_00046178, partial [Ensete ventricosum]